MPLRRLHFHHGTRLAAAAALSALLAVVCCWLNWVMFLFLLDLLGAVAVTLLPAVVLFVGHNVDGRRHIGKVLLATGSVLVLHFTFLMLSIEYLLRQPMVFDLIPFDRILFSTLNWTVPSAAMGLLIGFVFHVRGSRPPHFWSGTAMIAGACAALLWYGQYLFGGSGESLADFVWWL